MRTNDEPAVGFHPPVRRSLTEPILMAGAPRSVVIINGTIAAAIGLGLRLWIVGALLWLIGHIIAVWAARRRLNWSRQPRASTTRCAVLAPPGRFSSRRSGFLRALIRRAISPIPFRRSSMASAGRNSKRKARISRTRIFLRLRGCSPRTMRREPRGGPSRWAADAAHRGRGLAGARR